MTLSSKPGTLGHGVQRSFDWNAWLECTFNSHLFVQAKSTIWNRVWGGIINHIFHFNSCLHTHALDFLSQIISWISCFWAFAIFVSLEMTLFKVSANENKQLIILNSIIFNAPVYQWRCQPSNTARSEKNCACYWFSRWMICVSNQEQNILLLSLRNVPFFLVKHILRVSIKHLRFFIPFFMIFCTFVAVDDIRQEAFSSKKCKKTAVISDPIWMNLDCIEGS